MSTVRSRITAALGASSFGQATVILMQLAALPLFLSKWDASTYGTWLMLTAVPAYLSIADGGLVLAAANRATMYVAQGNNQSAERAFQSAFAFLICASVVVLSVTAPLILWVGIPGLDSADTKIALIILVCGILLSQYNGLAECILRACNSYAQGIMLGNVSRLLEFGGWMIGLFAYGTFTAVAATGILFRAIGLTWTVIATRKFNSKIKWGLAQAQYAECKQLAKSGLMFLAFPLTNALSLQGVTLIVGYLISPAAVTVFNTYRTLTRFSLQITTALGNSIWAEFSKMYANADMHALRKLYQKSYLIGTGVSIITSLAIYFAAPFIIEIWTRGHIDIDRTLLLLMLLAALAGGAWNVPRVLMMATNNHGKLVIQSLFGAAMSVLLAYTFAKQFGIHGVAFSVLTIELVLAAACISSTHRLLSLHNKNTAV